MTQMQTRPTSLFWSADVPLDQVLVLLAQTPKMENRNLDMICRGVIPPINLRQSVGVFEDGFLVGWASWAFMSNEKSDIFLQGEYDMKPDDWRCGTEPIFMDFVAPFGHTFKLYRALRCLFPNLDVAKWRRHMKHKRVDVRMYNG